VVSIWWIHQRLWTARATIFRHVSANDINCASRMFQCIDYFEDRIIAFSWDLQFYFSSFDDVRIDDGYFVVSCPESTSWAEFDMVCLRDGRLKDWLQPVAQFYHSLLYNRLYLMLSKSEFLEAASPWKLLKFKNCLISRTLVFCYCQPYASI
jgi:hypothetical protein